MSQKKWNIVVESTASRQTDPDYSQGNIGVTYKAVKFAIKVNDVYVAYSDYFEEAKVIVKALESCLDSFCSEDNTELPTVIERDKLGKIRLWKLGNVEQKIIASQKTVDNFISVLKSVNGNGDLVWNDAISCEVIG